MKLWDYFFAARPLLQLPIWTVYLISLHYHHKLSRESFGSLDLLIMIGISLVFTGAAYLNQVYDFETDQINRKVGFLQSGLLSPSRLSAGCIILTVLPLALAPLVSLLTLFVFAQFVLLALIYSMPPVRLKDRPIGGLFANAYSHGFLVSVAVMPHMTLHNSGLLGWDNPLYFFFAVGAVFSLTTIPDRAGDAATGKRTVAVVLGRDGALAIALILFSLAGYTAWRSGYQLLFVLALGALLLSLASLVWRNDASVRFAAKMPLLGLTLAAGYLYPVYLLFVVALLIGTRAYYRRRFGVVYPELA